MLRKGSRGVSMPSLDDQTLDELYEWLEPVPFSRRRRNMARDFSDGVLTAELVAHLLPRYVDLNAYRTANSVSAKKYNWDTLNKMVFAFLNFHVSPELIDQIVGCQAGAIEFVLTNLRVKIDMALSGRQFKPNRHRSKSHGRTDSSLSINSLGVDIGESASGGSTTGHSSCSHHLPKQTPAVGAAKEQLYQDLVPARQLHNAQQQLLLKDEQIQTFQARVRHMERLISLKEDRIAELVKRLDRVTQLLYQQRPPPPPPQPERPNVAEIIASMLANATGAASNAAASLTVTAPPPPPTTLTSSVELTDHSGSSAAAAGGTERLDREGGGSGEAESIGLNGGGCELSTPSSPPSSSLRRRSDYDDDDLVSPDLPPPPSIGLHGEHGHNGRTFDPTSPSPPRQNGV